MMSSNCTEGDLIPMSAISHVLGGFIVRIISLIGVELWVGVFV